MTNLLRHLAIATPLVTACGSSAPQGPQHLDLVLITLDTTRADHLGTYGYFRDTSPTLDALAAESVVFERAIAPMATTLPTHTSILTATHPLEHGVLANLTHGGSRFAPSAEIRTVAAVLQEAGYTNGAFVSAAPLYSDTGLSIGFDAYNQPNKRERRGGATVTSATSWLAEAPADKPYFIWTHFYDPHNPYQAPKTHQGEFTDGSELDDWIAARGASRRAVRPTGHVVVTTTAVTNYDEEIRYMDDQVAKLLDAVKARGRWDQTVVVVVGDHGEGLNQHNEPGHGLVWDEQLRSPLFIRVPGVPPKRVAHTVSLTDTFPTLFGLAEFPGEEGFLEQASGLDTLSEEFEPRPSLSMQSKRQEDFFGKPRTTAWTSDTHKLIWIEGEGSTLFDLAADPFELTPIVDQPDTVAALTAQMQATITTFTERGVDLGSGQLVEMEPEVIERLRELGYMEGDAEPSEGSVENIAEPDHPQETSP